MLSTTFKRIKYRSLSRGLASISAGKIGNWKKNVPLLRAAFAAEEREQFVVPVFKKALLYVDRIAIEDARDQYSYLKLYVGAKKLSFQISNICGSGASINVAHCCAQNVLNLVAQWACWMSGQVCLPIDKELTNETIQHIVKDAKSSLLICTPEYEQRMEKIANSLDISLIVIEHNFLPTETTIEGNAHKLVLGYGDQITIEGVLCDNFYSNANALLVYTFGSSGKPNPVIVSHKKLHTQIENLSKIWHVNSSDMILNTLPSSCFQGCTVGLMCPLSRGATVILPNSQNIRHMWDILFGLDIPLKDKVNIVLGTPSLYKSIITEYEKVTDHTLHAHVANCCKTHIRLMVCGSVPMPMKTFNRWYDITGCNILQYYDTTETGIVLSNSHTDNLDRPRQPANDVGVPLPNVNIRLLSPENDILLTCNGREEDGSWFQFCVGLANEDDSEALPITGELCVSKECYQKYSVFGTKSKGTFIDGYFKTGDLVSYQKGVFKIIGRLDTDIVRIGGNVVICLDIETLLFTHPSIADVTVISVPHSIWDDFLYVVCVLRPGASFDLESLKSYCTLAIASYIELIALKIVHQLPRNKIGKLNKKELVEVCFNTNINHYKSRIN